MNIPGVSERTIRREIQKNPVSLTADIQVRNGTR